MVGVYKVAGNTSFAGKAGIIGNVGKVGNTGILGKACKYSRKCWQRKYNNGIAGILGKV